MKSITIKGSKRESVGKKSSRTLRDAGMVPCVLYGGNDKVVHFSAKEIDFNPLVYTADVHTVKLDIDGKVLNAVLQDIQFHPVTDAILHMDFYQFEEDQPINMTIPVQHVGQAIGVKRGGRLQFNLRRLNLNGLVSNLPDFIEVDISKLKIGDKLYVTAVESEDYTILHNEDEVICQVITSRKMAATAGDDEDEDEDEEGTEEAATEATEAQE